MTKKEIRRRLIYLLDLYCLNSPTFVEEFKELIDKLKGKKDEGEV